MREYDEYERKGVCMKEGEWVGVNVNNLGRRCVNGQAPHASIGRVVVGAFCGQARAAGAAGAMVLRLPMHARPLFFSRLQSQWPQAPGCCTAQSSRAANGEIHLPSSMSLITHYSLLIHHSAFPIHHHSPLLHSKSFLSPLSHLCFRLLFFSLNQPPSLSPFPSHRPTHPEHVSKLVTVT